MGIGGIITVDFIFISLIDRCMEVGRGYSTRKVGPEGPRVFAREDISLRGYRPGRYGLPEEASEEAQITRMANIEIYARRVRAGLPIFRKTRDIPVVGGNMSGL